MPCRSTPVLQTTLKQIVQGPALYGATNPTLEAGSNARTLIPEPVFPADIGATPSITQNSQDMRVA